MTSRSDTILGLIAGQGRLPILVARGMRAAGARVCCIGLRDQFDADLPAECDEFATAGVIQLGRWIRLLRKQRVREAVMVGRVNKLRLHDPFKLFRQLPDWRAAKVWYRRLRHDRRNAALLAAVAEELQVSGITLIDSTTYITDHLAGEGVLGRIQPTAEQQRDIAFGWPLLQQVVELDIGQSIAVRQRDVITVEAIEGTDAMIERAGALCRARGWTFFKTSKATHDMRADVPTIGVETIERLARAGAGCVALGAGRVILIDKPAVRAAADDAKISVIGMPPTALGMSNAEVTLDLSAVGDARSLHDCLARTLQLPGHYGRNFDALDECLADEDVGLPSLIRVIGWAQFSQACPREAHLLRTVLSESLRARRLPCKVLFTID